MFSVFFKKKISEEKLVQYFTVTTVKMVDDAFEDVAEIINSDPEFKYQPQIDPKNVDPFLWIVIAGNLQFIPRYFNDYQDIRILDIANRQLSEILQVPVDSFKLEIKKTTKLFNQLNHPSKNTVYAMSKAVFHSYELAKYQNDYFRKMKTPNPIFLKRLNEVMESFIFDWEKFSEEYKIIE